MRRRSVYLCLVLWPCCGTLTAASPYSSWGQEDVLLYYQKEGYTTPLRWGAGALLGAPRSLPLRAPILAQLKLGAVAAGARSNLRGHLNSRVAAPRQSTHPPRRHKQERR